MGRGFCFLVTFIWWERSREGFRRVIGIVGVDFYGFAGVINFWFSEYFFC